ncbi:MAG: ComEA family DNA-binding protein [Chloroflexi bacterium]|nr:ComEA family DNA-binding protein [Chloroflexota bacterium]MBI3339574.1 ComEA family DNA-binding protein [Chloroflexota bacterium]
MKQILNVLIGVLAGLIMAGGIVLVVRLPKGVPVTLEPAPTAPPLTVQVIGAVVRPGVYVFPVNSRVQDAVTAAGGMLAEANPNLINLAAKLEDGQQLDIPFVGGAAPTSTGPFVVLPTPGTGTANKANLVNINTATAEELDTLPGIGPATAQKIIDYRDQNGPFNQIEDIMNVPGIGPSTFDLVKDLITVY